MKRRERKAKLLAEQHAVLETLHRLGGSVAVWTYVVEKNAKMRCPGCGGSRWSFLAAVSNAVRGCPTCRAQAAIRPEFARQMLRDEKGLAQ